MYGFGLTYKQGDSFVTEGYTTREEAEAARVTLAAEGCTDISEVLDVG